MILSTSKAYVEPDMFRYSQPRTGRGARERDRRRARRPLVEDLNRAREIHPRDTISAYIASTPRRYGRR